MDIEELKDFEEKVHHVFIDSNDARFTAAPTYRELQPDGSFKVYADTATSRAGTNPANGYTLWFGEVFKNVVSVEILKAWIPTVPLRPQAKYDPDDITATDPLRYITVSMPQIEQHMERHKASINWPFKGARIAWDTLDGRDFIVYEKPFVERRRFHPIGKMDQLTFNFYKNSLSDGDTACFVKFKGFHHQLLVEITTLVPAKVSPEEYPLAPAYDPHARTTNYIRPDLLCDEDSDDDDLLIPSSGGGKMSP
jgi:hypothetical protein